VEGRLPEDAQHGHPRHGLQGYGQGQSANVVSKGMYASADGAFPTGTGTRTNFPMLIKIIT
jgi:hypothetical protein